MTERADATDDTRAPAPEAQTVEGVPPDPSGAAAEGGAAPPADAPELSQAEGAEAVAEGAQQAVEPAESPAPAPALDQAATTPDRGAGGEGDGERRPELLVAGAFAGGLAVAMVLKRVARG